MSGVQQKTSNEITLRGSAEIIAEYLYYGINSILFQRGIYPSETFNHAVKYGLTILISSDDGIKKFLDAVLDQIKEWLVQKKVNKLTMVITSVNTKEVLERWDFCVKYEGTVGSDGAPEVGNKPLKDIQKEIQDVIRQITASVTYLPLLDCICSFDLLIYTLDDTAVPEEWSETEPCIIANSQEVRLRTFSTSLHKMETIVSYKADG
ncbi:mitotic spindle assembly checkpoint protein MAD2A [Hetaerina americana]|uniref:mitotic spindle assembly checkpoint protein MAD2A n=1 Tax=Hetaerina americana TaxID=62018 RepID=UPI003A7F35A7